MILRQLVMTIRTHGERNENMMKPLNIHRIALMLESDGPGGAESVFLTFATHLRDLGFEVRPVVLAGRGGWLSGRLKQLGFDVFMPRLQRPISPDFALTLRRWLKENSIDLVHAHEFTLSFYGGVASCLSGIPYILTFHGGMGFAKAMRRRLVLSVVARASNSLVCVSDATSHRVSKALWLDPSKTQVIPNGIDTIIGDRETGRKSLGVTPDEYLILSIGNLYPVKGHEYLIRAAHILSERTDLRPWRIVIAGRGEREAALRELIAQLGLENRVFLLGLRTDIPDLVAASDQVVMPSLSEGMPIALLEASLAKKPLVCSAVGGIPELVRDGEEGLLVPPANPVALAEAMARLVCDTDLASYLAANVYLRAQSDYSAEAMVHKYLTLYQK